MFIQVREVNNAGWTKGWISLNTDLVLYFQPIEVIQGKGKITSTRVVYQGNYQSMLIRETLDEIELLVNKAYANLRGRLF